MNCIICFSPIKEKYCCSDQKCKDFFCQDCMIDLIEFCVGEKMLPKCPSRDCTSYLTMTNMTHLPKDLMLKYYQLCLDYFLKDQGNVIEKQIQEKALLKKHCEDRQKFIKEEFPEGISLMASIAFKPKLKRLEKQKAKVLKEQVKLRSCMNSTCAGYLEDLICTICQTEFCKRCEKTVDQNHTCKQEDLDSVNFVQGLINCPGCGHRVFKNEGCDSISCSICQTNFSYSTGEKGGHGSLNVKIAVNVEQRYKLSNTFKTKIPSSCLKRLLQLESLEPKVISKDIMLVPVKKYIETKDDKWAKVLANKIDQYHQNRFLNRDYQANMVKLEKMLRNEVDEVKFSHRLDRSIKQFT